MPRNMDITGRLAFAVLAFFAAQASAQVPCGGTTCILGVQICNILDVCVLNVAGVTCGTDADCTITPTTQCGPVGTCIVPVTCESNDDCTDDLLPVCNDLGVCVPDTPATCETNDDCTDDLLPVCNDLGVCVPDTPVTCDTNDDCPDLLPTCNDLGVCVPDTPVTCETNDDCTDDLLPVCNDLGVCVPDTPVTCDTDSDCPDLLPTCSALGVCIPPITCETNADCTNSLFPICNDLGVCIPDTPVTCDTNSDCPDLLPICNDLGVCIPDTPITCDTNSDCPDLLPTCSALGVCIPDTPVTCDNNDDCPDILPICSDLGVCIPDTPVTCDSDEDCPDLLPICSDLGVCIPGGPKVGCDTDDDCTNPDQPVCDRELAICVPGDDDTTTTTTGGEENPTETGDVTEEPTNTSDPTGTNTDDGDNTTEPTGTNTDDGDNTTEPTGTKTDDSEDQTTGTDSSSPTETGSEGGNPSTVDGFRLLGCFGSDNGFPGFSTELTSDEMDLELCAEQCNGQAFFGTHRNECLCGTDDSGLISTDIDRCDIDCPGDDSEKCGGDVSPNPRLFRRQGISNNILLSVYVAIGFVPEGVDTTVTTTFVSTVTDASGPVATTITTAVVCKTGVCGSGTPSGPVFVFNPYPGEDCVGEKVYLASPCSCVGGVEYFPHVCDSHSCTGKTVFKPEEKSFDGSSQVYYPAPCNSTECKGIDSMYKPFDKDQVEYKVPGSNQGSNSNGKGSDSGSKGYENGAENSSKGSGGGSGKDTEVPVVVSVGEKQIVATLALLFLPVVGALAGWL